MKPVDPEALPFHMRKIAGRTGLVHGSAPMLPRSFTRAHANREKPSRKGAKARAKLKRIMLQRFGIS